MGISGSLSNFSLPEIFQIIQYGFKTGRLSITFNVKDRELQNDGINYLWFKNGYFVALAKPYKYNYLLNLLVEENLISYQELAKIYDLQSKIKIPLGKYCREKELLSNNQLNRLFKKQLEMVALLFESDDGNFLFEDLDKNNLVSSDRESFPFMEMTGKIEQPITISLNTMRSLTKMGKRYLERMPDPSSSLTKLMDSHSFRLIPIEACLWNDTNKGTSLKKIAEKTLFDIKDLQKSALRLILIGLLEEKAITEYSSPMPSSSYSRQNTTLPSSNNIVSTKSKNEISNSLLGNLVNFLKNNF